MIEFPSGAEVAESYRRGHYGQKIIILDIGNFTRAHIHRKYMIVTWQTQPPLKPDLCIQTPFKRPSRASQALESRSKFT